MADITGEMIETFGGREYTLRLTMRGIAALQAKHGKNIGGLLDGTAGDIPDFGPLLDLVSLALQKGHAMTPEEADALADDLLTADPQIVGRIVSSTFPDAAPGK